jgi:hypothetical protein
MQRLKIREESETNRSVTVAGRKRAENVAGMPGYYKAIRS